MRNSPILILLLFISIFSTAASAETKTNISPVFIQPDGKNNVMESHNNVDPNVQSLHFNQEAA